MGIFDGKKTPSQTSDPSNLDDLDFDFDELGMDSDWDADPADRKPSVASLTKNTAKGVAEGLFTKDTIARALKKTLPKSYGEVVDFADSFSKTVDKEYQETVKSLKPNINRIKASTKRLYGENKELLPEGNVKRWLDDQVNKISEDTDNRIANAIDARADENDAVLKNIFSLEQEIAIDRDRKRDKDAKLDQMMAFNRHKESQFFLNQLAMNTSRLVNYQDNVNVRYQRKMLELQLRQYDLNMRSFEMVKNNQVEQNRFLADIVKNTGLPEAQKVKFFETFGQRAKEHLADRIQNKLFDSTGFINRAITNVVGSAKQKVNITNIMEALGDGIDGAINAGELIRDTSSDMSHDDIAYLIGSTIGEQAITAGEWAGKTKYGKKASAFAKKHILKGKDLRDVVANSKVGKNANKAGYALRNIEAYTQNRMESFDSEAVEKWADDKLPKWLGSKRGDLFEKLFDSIIRQPLMQSTSSHQRIAVGSGDLNGHATLTNRSVQTLNEVIPGYLARILQQVTIANRGTASLLTYDFNSNRFKATSSIRDEIVSKIRLDSAGETQKGMIANDMLAEIDTDGKIDSMTRNKFAQIVAMQAISGIVDAKFLTAKSTYEPLGEQGKVLRKLMVKHLTGDKSQNNLNELNRKSHALKGLYGNPANYLQGIADNGQADIIRSLGLIKDDGSGGGTLDINTVIRILNGELPGDQSSTSRPSYLNNTNRRRRRNFTGPGANSNSNGGADTDLLTAILNVKTFNTGQFTEMVNHLETIAVVNGSMFGRNTEQNAAREVENQLNRSRDRKHKSFKSAANSWSSATVGTSSGLGSVGISTSVSRVDYIRSASKTKNDDAEAPVPFDDNSVLNIPRPAELMGPPSPPVTVPSSVGSDQAPTDVNETYDIYMPNEQYPRITRQGMDNGQYSDGNGKTIKTIKDLGVDVYDKLGNIVLSAKESTEALIKRPGKMETLKSKLPGLLGKAEDFKNQAMNIWNAKGGFYGMLAATTKLVGIKAFQKLQDYRTFADDVFVKGEPDAVLTKGGFERGEYISKKTGKLIRSIKDIDSDVLDREGNTVVKLSKIAKGVYDRKGTRVGGFMQRVWNLQHNKLVKLALLPAKMYIGAYKWAFKRTWKNAVFAYKRTKSLVNWITDDRSGQQAMVATGEQTNSLLASLGDLINEKLPDNKKLFGDTDGDGDAENSAKDQWEKRRRAKEAREQAARERAEKRDSDRKKKSRDKDEDDDDDDESLLDKARNFYDDWIDRDGKRRKGGRRGRGRGGRGRLGRLGRGAAGAGRTVLPGAATTAAAGATRSSAANALGRASSYKLAQASPEVLASISKGMGGAGAGVAAKAAPGMLGKLGAMGAAAGGLGKMIPGLGLLVGGGMTVNSLANGDYMGAAINGGSTLLGQAVFGGGLAGATGSLGALGSGAAAAGTFLVSNPIGWAILGTAAVAAIGYGAYKWWKNNKPNDYSKLRIAQYGFNPEGDYAKKVMGFERMILDASDQNGAVDIKKVDSKDLLELFEISPEDTEMQQRFAQWYDQRFLPVFQAWRKAMFSVAKENDLQALKVNANDGVRILEAVKVPESIYSVQVSPFKTLNNLETSAGDVAKLFEETAAKAKGGVNPDGTNKLTGWDQAKMLAKGALTGPLGVFKAVYDIKKTKEGELNAAKESSKLTKTSSNILASGTITSINSAGEKVTGIDPKKLDALTAVRFKTYGLGVLDPEKILTLAKLESIAMKYMLVTGKNEIKYNAPVAKILSETMSLFGIAETNHVRQDYLKEYLEARFMPVMSAFIRKTAEFVKGGDYFNNASKLPYDQQLAIATETRDAKSTYGGMTRSVWEIRMSPWSQYDLNILPDSTAENFRFLNGRGKTKPASEEALQKGANTSNAVDAAQNSFASSMMNTIKNAATSIYNVHSNIMEGARNFIGSQYQNAKEQISGVLSGEKSVGQAFSDFWDGTKANAMDSLAKATGGQKGLMIAMYGAFRKAGFTDAQSRYMMAECGRENSFRESVIFGYHIDPKNGALNVGMFSWQGSRGKQLQSLLAAKGLLSANGMARGQASLDVQAQFIMQEMKTTEARSGSMFLARPNITDAEAIEILGGKYIRWALNNPKYRAGGLRNRAHWLAEVNKALEGVPLDSAGGGNGMQAGLMAGAAVGQSMANPNNPLMSPQAAAGLGQNMAKAALAGAPASPDPDMPTKGAPGGGGAFSGAGAAGAVIGAQLGGSATAVHPLPKGTFRVGSRFGMRIHPISKVPKMHSGQDFPAPNGTPVMASGDGTVTFAGVSGSLTKGYGRLVTIKHADGTETKYGHLNSINIQQGAQVKAGTKIGTVGSSGGSTGPHLHYEVRKGGKPVDPIAALKSSGSATPAEAAMMKAEGNNPSLAATTDPAAAVASGTPLRRITAEEQRAIMADVGKQDAARTKALLAKNGINATWIKDDKKVDVNDGNPTGSSPDPDHVDSPKLSSGGSGSKSNGFVIKNKTMFNLFGKHVLGVDFEKKTGPDAMLPKALESMTQLSAEDIKNGKMFGDIKAATDSKALGRGNLATTSNKHIEKLKKDMADEAKRVRDEKVKKDEALKKAAVVETNSERSRQTAAANAKYQNDVKKAEEARLTSDVRELVVVSREGNDILRSILAVLGGKNPERQVPNTIKEQVVKTEPSKPFYDRGAPVTNYVSMGKTVYS